MDHAGEFLEAQSLAHSARGLALLQGPDRHHAGALCLQEELGFPKLQFGEIPREREFGQEK